MEEKKKGRPRSLKPVEESQRYRSSSEELEELKEERLAKMKQILKRGGGAVKTLDIPKKEAETVKTALNGNFARISAAQRQVEELSGLCNKSDEPVDAVLAKSLTLAQIEALGKVCRTDDMIDAMLAALEECGANQRWLNAAKASFQCAMMELSRAILKPKGI